MCHIFISITIMIVKNNFTPKIICNISDFPKKRLNALRVLVFETLIKIIIYRYLFLEIN